MRNCWPVPAVLAVLTVAGRLLFSLPIVGIALRLLPVDQHNPILHFQSNQNFDLLALFRLWRVFHTLRPQEVHLECATT